MLCVSRAPLLQCVLHNPARHAQADEEAQKAAEAAEEASAEAEEGNPDEQSIQLGEEDMVDPDNADLEVDDTGDDAEAHAAGHDADEL